MAHVTSRDGTPIAFARTGSGPPVILLNGALSHRGLRGDGPLASALATDFSVTTFDRRGRGESGDAVTYTVDREIEDIAALIDARGGSAALYGSSSGAALALRAADALGAAVTRLVLFEPPYEVPSDDARAAFEAYTREVDALLAAGRHGDAVARFLSDMLPPEIIEEMRGSPEWAAWEAVAPTLAYDDAVLGDGLVPIDLASRVRTPTLVLVGGGSMPFFREAAEVLVAALPDGRLAVLEGQDHSPEPEAIAAAIRPFLSG